MKNSALQICNETIHPGESIMLALPLPELFSCAPLYMPIKVIHGKQAGPCLLITAAMHGNELNGTEIINRLLETSMVKKLQGTLIAIPVLNVYGLINRSRDLPGGISLDDCFPGSKSGTNAARMAYTFTNEIFDKADVTIDLQTGFLNHSNVAQVFVNFEDKKAKALAEVFNPPVISNTALEPGMLRTYAFGKNKPFLTYEAGEAMRFDEHSIKVGLKGILNVMRKLDMMPDKFLKKESVRKSFLTEKNMWVRAPASGISYTVHKLGQYVRKGETLCVLKDPIGSGAGTPVVSPEEAVIVGKNNIPLVHEGEALFQLAVFPKMKDAASQLKEWKDKA